MAQIFNPWQSPEADNVLPNSLATFAINGQEDPEGMAEPSESEDESGMESEHGDAMSQALGVIQQQSQLIAELMAMLGTSK